MNSFFRILRNYIKEFWRDDFDKILKKKIKRISGTLVISKPGSQIFMTSLELNNHNYISVKITGVLNIATTKGCHLKFVGKQKEFIMNSDSKIIVGEYGNREKIGLTRFDINLNDDFVEFVNSNTIKRVLLEIHNGKILSENLIIEYGDINQPELISVVGSLD